MARARSDGRRALVTRLAVYAILVAATAVTLFPVAWMATVSIRPNVDRQAATAALAFPSSLRSAAA